MSWYGKYEEDENEKHPIKQDEEVRLTARYLNKDNSYRNYPRPEDGNILQYEKWIIDELVDSGVSNEEAIILVDENRDIISNCFTLDADAGECAMNIMKK